MGKIENSMDCIDALMDKMLAKGISSVYLKDKDFEIKIETNCGKNQSQQQSISGNMVPQYQQLQPQFAPVAQQPIPAPVAPVATPAPQGDVVKAPIVGTFYASASPKDEPFVKVGQTVKKGDVIYIIESMKVMNEVKSEFDGTVIAINVKNGEVVEFDQPVMIIG